MESKINQEPTATTDYHYYHETTTAATTSATATYCKYLFIPITVIVFKLAFGVFTL